MLRICVAGSLMGLMLGVPVCVLAQQAANVSAPKLEVATIKPSAPDEHARSVGWEGRKFTAHYSTMSQVMQFAYGVQAKQILGAPAWFDATTYDVDVQADVAEPTREQWKVVLQQMLSERLQLKVHPEQKVMPAYVLTVDKDGPKLKPPMDEEGMESFGVRIARGPHELVIVRSIRGSMGELASELQRVEMDRPVVDKTGLTGRFNFEMRATSTKPFFAGETPDTSDDAPPILFTALREQLGLRLEPAKTEVDCLAVDRVERPSEN